MIIAPVRGKYRITQGFGENPRVYDRFGMKGHNGQDLALPIGTPLYAPIDGVCKVGHDKNGYGLYIRITEERKEERRQVILAHLDDCNFKTGDMVKAGEKVGTSGNTGFSTGPHLHWGLRRLSRDGSVLNYDNGYFGYEDIFEKGWITKNEPSIY